LIVGLELYGVNLKDISKIMGKKFACGGSVLADDKYGECVQVQGDIADTFNKFVESEMKKYNIPTNQIVIIDESKKKKGATATAGAK
jgi:translation initiation factor 1 (eIF-1/SUI1)